MTQLRLVDYYNTWMNNDASAYTHGSWTTYEDMQIAALCAMLASCNKSLLFGVNYIKVEDVLELISQLETQSKNLKRETNV